MIPKFRAWFITNKVMIPPMALTQAIHQKENQFSLARLEDEFIFMQSTGLFDKNGVEIYEGDIITWESPEMTQSTWIGIVFRNGSEFSVRKSKKTYSTGAWLNSACRPTNNIITVIGNIYENKELLEVAE